MSEFKMPSLGADMESAVLMEWKVKEGDHVTKGQVIAEVETSKGVIEIEVFETGVVEKILVEEETECAVGTPLALIASEGEGREEAVAEAAAEPEKVPPQPEPPSKEEPLKPEPQEEERPAAEPAERVKASPAARRKARELGVDLAALAAGSDRGIQLDAVEAAAETAAKAPEADGMRQAIARAMSRSNAEIPHYYLSTSVNMTPALAWLAALNAKRSIKERILPAALLIRAVVKALEAVPELNGFWQEERHSISKTVNPGIAIALRKGGLITPALLSAETMNLDETMHSLDDLITRTRSGRLRGSEMTQQTVTITNLGDLGVERVYGVIYPPQVAIVGLGRIIDAPWAEGDALSVRKVMQATIAGDHRATDGRTGALFLERLDHFLQNPQELL
ncbi:dihydrolipoamide acetyltransferase family protein [Sulfurimonas sp. HSL3-7]|uniref:dihydrolipoamide acetyltransferase family protein n=1 Tax=Sulfonitrofixus jiaomeiensis TaxID=3131938 RepID=UPI0031F724B0